MSVYANGLEIAGKAKKGKSIACTPDPCFSPPAPSAGWIVIPYANTAYAKDTANASKTVFIEGKPVMLKDKSYFKTSTGNEAAAGPKGVVTGVKKGKAYFTSWSMDIKAEGYNVCRHSDMITHNHGSTGNTTVWHYSDGKSGKPPKECFEDCVEIEKACGDHDCSGGCQQQKAEAACGGKPPKDDDKKAQQRHQARQQYESRERGKASALLGLVEKGLKKKGIHLKLEGTWKSQKCFPCAIIKPSYKMSVQDQIDCLKKQKEKITESLQNLDQLVAKGVDWDDVPGLAKELGLDYLRDGSVLIPTPTKVLKVAGCLMSDGGLCADLINLYSIPDAITQHLKKVSSQVTQLLDNMDEALEEAEDLKNLKTEDVAKLQEECVEESKCLRKRKCLLEPYDKSNGVATMLDNEGCCPGQTAHHLIPNAMYQSKRKDNTSNISACPNYDLKKAPNVCVEGSTQGLGSHKKIHDLTEENLLTILKDPELTLTYDEAKSAALEAHKDAFPGAGCERKCLEKQLDQYRDDACGSNSNPRLRKSNGKTGKKYEEPDDGCPL